MMVDRARRLRDQIQEQCQSQKAHEGRRYPEQLRESIVGYVQEKRDAGVPVMASARILGLNVYTLYGWLRDARQPGRFRGVRVVSGRAPGSAGTEMLRLSLVSPQGYRVEGLDVASVSQLLRELS